MHTLTTENLVDYLVTKGWVEDATGVASIRELDGGVSNVVYCVQFVREPTLIVKQSRQRLRVAGDWQCSVQRIWREVDVLEWCDVLLSECPADGPTMAATLPRVIHEDRSNYCFAMTSAAMQHTTWKRQLMAGNVSPDVATRCGKLLATLHGQSWDRQQVADSLSDQTYFEDLRLNPYFRHVAERRPEVAAAIGQVIESLRENSTSLVHGDFSPKNLLASKNELMLIDCEVGHYGDPAFDLGFFLSHLVLKAIYLNPKWEAVLALACTFCQSYFFTLAERLSERFESRRARAIAALDSRGVACLAACLLARVDGKSPVEYLAAQQRVLARELGQNLLMTPPSTLADALLVAKGAIETL